MSVTVTDETMRAIVAKGIFDSMTADDREKLMIGALAHLIEPQEGQGYSQKRPSVLQQQFNFQTAQIAAQLVSELIERDPTVKERIGKLVADAIGKMFDGEDNQRRLTDAIAEGFRKSFGERY